MNGRLARRLAALERRSDPLAAWRGVPLEQCPDHVLVAIIGEAKGRPPNYMPSDDVLRAINAEGEDEDEVGAA